MKKYLLQAWNKVLLKFNRIDYDIVTKPIRPKNDEIPSKTVLIVGHENFPKWALLRCPCGCNEVLTLSLMGNYKPNWQFNLDEWHKVSLSPSVWKTDGCKSHFFIKHGKVVWA